MATSIDGALIDEIVRRICTVARPDRIILFGSAATGQMTRHSDIDLLVLEREPGNTREASVRVGDALRGLGYPFDVIVMSLERCGPKAALAVGPHFPRPPNGGGMFRAIGRSLLIAIGAAAI